MQDPRDKQFYKLQKKDRLQLSKMELLTYIEYCKKMLLFVNDKKSRKDWKQLLCQLEEKC